ncbi:MAG TPA: hypothetical protein DHV62_06585 [Elusimicrobia bacterium]|jgi:cytochrome c-type biogenesis protein|nr:hypothetical protein [Elusimicrobiota bacterium]
MFEIITQYANYLEKVNFLSYPICLFLGFLAGVAAITCCLPIIPVVISFIGGQEITKKKLILVPFFIMLGSIIILGIFGITVSLAGLTLQKHARKYWHYIVGIICILIGLVTLRIIKIPEIKLSKIKYKGFFAPLLFGLVMGGVIGFGSSCCAPVLPIVLTYATIQGRPLHGALILSSFAIGQSIPIFGIGVFSTVFGKIASRWTFYVQKVAGILLLAGGIYFIIWGR